MLRHWRCVDKHLRGANNQIVLGGDGGHGGGQRHPRIVRALKHHVVAPVEQLEYCLQRMIAIAALPGNMQEQIKLGGRERANARELGHGIDSTVNDKITTSIDNAAL